MIFINSVDSNERRIFLDYLRIFSTFVVIFSHVTSDKLYSLNVNSTDWQITNICESLARYPVPLFVMISGTLFLNRNFSINSIYKKYIFRLIISFFVWSFFYYLFYVGDFKQNFMNLFSKGKTGYLVIIIKGHYHLWFIPTIIGVYMAIPIIKKIIYDKKVLEYFLILSFIFWLLIPQAIQLIRDFGTPSSINLVNAFGYLISEMNINIFLGYIFYFILGYYLSNLELSNKKRKILYLFGLIGFLFTCLITSFLSLKFQKPVLSYYKNYGVNTMLLAVSIFVFFQNHNFKLRKINNFIIRMSKFSFGAFLVHPFFISKIRVMTFSKQLPNSLYYILIISVIVFVCSFLVSALLNKIPLVKKYIV